MEVVAVSKVSDFIDGLEAPLRARVNRMITLLEENGPVLRMPYSRALGHGLFELRVVGGVHARIIYFFHEQRAILVHSLIKKQQKLTQRDIAYAQAIQKEVLALI